MSTIQGAKLSMGFLAAKQRPSCNNCYYCEERYEERMPPYNTKSWNCKKGGFMTSAMATCNQHQPVKR